MLCTCGYNTGKMNTGVLIDQGNRDADHQSKAIEALSKDEDQ